MSEYRKAAEIALEIIALEKERERLGEEIEKKKLEMQKIITA